MRRLRDWGDWVGVVLVSGGLADGYNKGDFVFCKRNRFRPLADIFGAVGAKPGVVPKPLDA
jgi:hypothetical protein